MLRSRPYISSPPLGVNRVRSVKVLTLLTFITDEVNVVKGLSSLTLVTRAILVRIKESACLVWANQPHAAACS